MHCVELAAWSLLGAAGGKSAGERVVPRDVARRWPWEAGRVVAAGTPQVRGCRSIEGTPEREFALGGKPGMQEAAGARRCLSMGGGAGELDLVAAAVRLQCAVRGVAARQVVGRALLVRRQAESRERLAAREAEVKVALVEARRESKRGSRRARQGRVANRSGE